MRLPARSLPVSSQLKSLIGSEGRLVIHRAYHSRLYAADQHQPASTPLPFRHPPNKKPFSGAGATAAPHVKLRARLSEKGGRLAVIDSLCALGSLHSIFNINPAFLSRRLCPSKFTTVPALASSRQ